MWSRDIPHEIPRRRLRPSNGKLVPITRAYRYQSPSPSASAVVPARERRRHKAPSQSFPQGGLADEGGPDTPPPRWCAAGTGGVKDGAHRAASAGLGRPRARGPSGERRSTGERNSTASWRARRLFALTWLRGLDLNQRPLGYEPNELPDCSTPRCQHGRYCGPESLSSRAGGVVRLTLGQVSPRTHCGYGERLRPERRSPGGTVRAPVGSAAKPSPSTRSSQPWPAAIRDTRSVLLGS
jgi:hypothetical protein